MPGEANLTFSAKPPEEPAGSERDGSLDCVADAAEHSGDSAPVVGEVASARVDRIDSLPLPERAAAYAALLDDLRRELEADGRG